MFCSQIDTKTNNMKQLISFLRCYPFFTLLLAGICVACFCKVPHTSLNHIEFIDKFVHAGMYLVAGGCMRIECMRHYKQEPPRYILFLIWLAPILFSGVIELLQPYFTNGRRNGEWLDFASNAAGATLANLILMSMSALRIKAYKVCYLFVLLYTLTFKQIVDQYFTAKENRFPVAYTG